MYVVIRIRIFDYIYVHLLSKYVCCSIFEIYYTNIKIIYNTKFNKFKGINEILGGGVNGVRKYEFVPYSYSFRRIGSMETVSGEFGGCECNSVLTD